jgi:hypothetical protein
MNRYKIFVSVVSYRDPLVNFTIKSLLENKSDNHDIIISFFDQSDDDNYHLVELDSNIIYQKIDPKFTNGVGWARHINSLNLSDEDFYYQIDSHVVFDKNWDEYLIKDYFKGVNYYNTDKIILSSACKCYTMSESGTPVKLDVYLEKPFLVKFIKDCGFLDDKFLNPHGNWYKKIPDDEVIPAIHLHAGNVFTHGDYIKNVGICPHLYFNGEEQHLTLNSFAHEYKLLHHTSIHIYHFNGSDRHISKPWNHTIQDFGRIQRFQELGLKYWRNYMATIDTEILERFFEYSGVDYINEVLEPRALTIFGEIYE